MDKSLLSLKDVALLLGVSRATVNYYTNLGLFHVVERKGNCRLYSKSDILGRFEKIKLLRKQGYPLQLIHHKLFDT